jgi:hypothetical protein
LAPSAFSKIYMLFSSTKKLHDVRRTTNNCFKPVNNTL